MLIGMPLQYTTNYKRGEPESFGQKVQFTGNNTKSMFMSVEASLKKLRTHYIDILYVHWWDYTTPVEEVMNSLHNLVAQGKVLYLVRRILRRRTFWTLNNLSRVSPTLRLGLCLRLTPTHGITERPPSSSIKVFGASSAGTLSATSSLWLAKRAWRSLPGECSVKAVFVLTRKKRGDVRVARKVRQHKSRYLTIVFTVWIVRSRSLRVQFSLGTHRGRAEDLRRP